MANILSYSLNEGLKASWKGALLGGTVGIAGGCYIANDRIKNSSDSLVATVMLVVVPIGGIFAGTIGGFGFGSTIGFANWSINGPLEDNPADEACINASIRMIERVAKFFFN